MLGPKSQDLYFTPFLPLCPHPIHHKIWIALPSAQIQNLTTCHNGDIGPGYHHISSMCCNNFLTTSAEGFTASTFAILILSQTIPSSQPKLSFWIRACHFLLKTFQWLCISPEKNNPSISLTSSFLHPLAHSEATTLALCCSLINPGMPRPQHVYTSFSFSLNHFFFRYIIGLLLHLLQEFSCYLPLSSFKKWNSPSHPCPIRHFLPNFLQYN